jgi:Zn-dependent peptidase ImmA (M78 family)
MYFPSFRVKKNGVPILSKVEIEGIAERFIGDFCPEALHKPMALDSDDFILNYLGLKQDFQYLSHNGIYLGMMVFKDTSKVPVYDPETNRAEYISAKARTVIIDNSLLVEKQEPRYRFTVMHEGGHDIFHPFYFQYKANIILGAKGSEEPLIHCRTVSDSGKVKPVSQWTDNDWMEWQCNYFSSAFHMPKSSVTKLIRELPPVPDSLRVYTYVSAVRDTYKMSWQAAGNRLRTLGIIKESIPSEACFLAFMSN